MTENFVPQNSVPDAGAVRRPDVLARLAFGDSPCATSSHTLGPRHLAFLPPESLELDLDDPAHAQFGDYHLLEKLGQGGMGVVYRARQISLDRDVAVKLLSAGPWASSNFIERFRREAQSAARMQHPNIVAIFEIGSQDELNFFSMRLVRGQSLAQLLAEGGPLAPRKAAALLRTIAEALDYAHRLGVLHLDLKPGNILIDERGEPQVADFGLARRMDETLAADNDEVSGTPSYMAPEQAEMDAQKLSPATDIYGLGAILYELLTGVPPFDAATPHETLARVTTHDAVPPHQLNPLVPRDLDAVCMKCLAKNPAQRYGSARALAEDLGRFIEGRQVGARQLHVGQRALRWAGREPRVAGAAAAAMIALVLGLVATTLQWRRADESAAVARANEDAARATAWSQRLTVMWQHYDRDEWLEALPRLVENLREQEAAGARMEAASERKRLGILLAASPRLIDVIALGRPVSVLALGPDGKRIAAMTRVPASVSTELWTLHMIDADSGRIRWSRELETGLAWLRFSGDGRTLFVEPRPGFEFDGYFQGADTLRIEADTGSTLPVPPTLGQPQLAVYSRDGLIALVVDAHGDMRSWHTDPWRAQGLSQPFEPDSRVLLSDDGGTVAYSAGKDRTRFALLDAATGRELHSIGMDPGKHMTAWRLSANGRLLAVASNLGDLTIFDARDGSRRILAQSCESIFHAPVFSADGAWIAATCAGMRTTVWQLGDGRPLAQVQHADWPSVIEVDNVHRTVFAHEQGQPRAYRIPPSPDRTGAASLATPMLNGGTARSYESGAFDPAHGLLALGTRSGSLKLWRMPPSPELPVFAPPLAGPDLEFDGRHLAVVNGSEAGVVGIPGAEPLGPALMHPQPVAFAALGADGASLITSSGREIRVWDWRRGALRFPALSLTNSPLRVFASPDGKRVLTSVGAYREGRFREQLRLWRTGDGEPLGSADFPGPLEGARFSADGMRLIAWRGNEVSLLDGRTLAGPLLTVRHHDTEGNAVNAMDARMNSGDELHVTTRRRNISYIAYYWRWDARTGAMRERLSLLGMAHRFALASSGGFAAYGFEFNRPRQFQRRHSGADLEWLPLPKGMDFSVGMAYSADGRWLAQAPVDGALLVDAATNVALSPALRTPSPMNDSVVQLAFDPAGERVVARTAIGRWLTWDVAPDNRSLPELEREQELYAPRSGAGWVEAAPETDPALRAALRARDPGAPAPAADAGAPEPNLDFPPRGAETSPLLLDLSAYYTPVNHREIGAWGLLDLRSVPRGIQRLLDVDFDIRGMVQLEGGVRPTTPQVFPHRVDGIALPPRALALDLLLGEYGFDNERHPVLDVVLHYRDGGERLIELGVVNGFPYSFQLEPDAMGEPESWRGARIAWLGKVRNGDHMMRAPAPLFLMRVRNPEPERELATLSLVARSAPHILAITAHTSLPVETGQP